MNPSKKRVRPASKMASIKPSPPLTYHRHRRQPGQDTLLSQREVPVAVLAIKAQNHTSSRNFLVGSIHRGV
eukprot:scaffold63107_cov81-Cyclotella_meneghiniana.AAC.6